ncbi:MAG: phosphatidylserine decarboxylase family protein [Bacteroidales bacterium]|nr:phosphatidylserine decarboxylase family protein [Bacteroidales bacterium]
MKIHKEGYKIIAGSFLLSVFIALATIWLFQRIPEVMYVVLPLLIAFNLWTVSFFRVPLREVIQHDDLILSSADGKIVVIEKVFEPEFYKEDRIQLSVFMSPFNVHVNWYPISGKIAYSRYHPGKFLVAYNPKSSVDNERTSIVVDQGNGKSVLIRQIAGMMARRIIYTASEGMEAEQGNEFGIIRFGSRVDFFLPVDAEVFVKLGDKVTGQQTVMARFARN